MQLEELVLEWNNSWRYDYWWRQKHNVAFNSDEHRAANQLDIAFEYFENNLANRALEQIRLEDERKKLKESGQWMKTNMDPDKENELIKKIDWNSFK